MSVAIETKVCSACSLPKPLSEFYLSRGRLRGKCKSCWVAKRPSRQANGRPAAVAVGATRKTCSACGVEKSATEFYRRSSGSGYLRGKCKDCCYAETNERRITPEGRERNREQTRRWRRNNHRRWRDTSLRSRLGIGIEDYERMWEEQEGRCAICRDELVTGSATHVDHDHATGAVRGLVCRACNLMLGFAKDDPTRLRAAIAYLERGE